MTESNRQLLTIGVFFIALVVAILLAVLVIQNWVLTIPLVLLFMGLWMMSLGALRLSKPVKYERGPFSTMALGACSIAVGGAWFLISYVPNYGWVYALVLILLVLGILAIAAAVKRK